MNSSSNQTHTLIVGFGSIGKRHKHILSNLGHDIAVVTKQDLAIEQRFVSCEQALNHYSPDYVVVANETYRHKAVLDTLHNLGYRGGLLVEKPLFDCVQPVPRYEFRFLNVAYQLRFHPHLAKLREELAGQKLINFVSYVGQYLPNWRPGTDYRSSYSAKKEQGGGVLADLSHELDYALWLLHGWSAVAARGGKYSDLHISSDDCFSLMIETPRCPVVCVHLSYLDRAPRRDITVNTTDTTYHVDLINGTFSKNGKVDHVNLDRNQTYQAMHQAVLGGVSKSPHEPYPCNLDEASDVISLMDAARQSATSYGWARK